MNIKIKNQFVDNTDKRNKFIFCVVVTLALGLIAHAYQFFHSSFSHDSLNALYADSTEIKWKIALGRYAVPIIMKLRGQIALPWVIGVISLFLIAVSLFLLTETFEIDSKIFIFLFSIFMVTNRTVYSMVATYIYELDYDMSALLFACLAAYLMMKKDKMGWFFLAVLSCILSLALYQSYIEVAIAIVIIASIKNIVEGCKYTDVLKRGFKAITTFIVGTVLYYGLYKLICNFTNVTVEGRTDALTTEGMFLTGNFKSMIYLVIRNVKSPISIYSNLFLGIIDIILILIGVILCLIMVFKFGKSKIGEIIIAVLLMVALPFSLNLISLTVNGVVHDLMVYSFEFLYIYSLTMIYAFTKNKKIKAINVIAGILCVVIGFNNIVVANTFYLKKDMEKTATVSLMTRVVDDLEERDDYIVGETPISFVGNPRVFKTYEGFDLDSKLPVGVYFTSSIKASVAQDESGDPYNSYKRFFTYYLNYPINYSSKDFSDNEKVKNMPTYPEKGYIQNIDGVLVVKMG